MYDDVARSVSILATRRDELYVIAQNLTEFWALRALFREIPWNSGRHGDRWSVN